MSRGNPAANRCLTGPSGCAPYFIRGHLTCTNKRAQADEKKIARNESFLALPAMHPLCVCSMLVPSEFSHLRKRSAKKLHFCAFLGNCCISESAKKLQKFFGSALSHLIICCFFLILVRVIAQEAPKTLKWPSGCAHLLVHIRRPPSVRPIGARRFLAPSKILNQILQGWPWPRSGVLCQISFEPGFVSKPGSTPTPWARGLQDQIQKSRAGFW